MHKKKSLIIFDIDGTLTDSVKSHQDAFKESLKLIGVELFNDKFSSYKHHTDSHISKVIYESSTKKIFEPSKKSFEEHLFNLISKEEIKEISGARNFVKKIEDESDFGVCYATGSLFRPAKYKLEQVGIEFIPKLLVASNNIEEREKIIQKAIDNSLKYYQIDSFERIISFGDGLWDLLSAQNLSLEFIGIGDSNKQILEEYGMKKHFSNFKNIQLAEL